MEYAIFPMQVINVTQRHYTAGSHKNLKAIDIAGKDTGIESAFAPFTCKLLNKAGSNTAYFGSCDLQGNQAQVMCEDGVARVLTIALTHDNVVSDIKIGQIFRTGEKFYDEGTYGNATGNHIHLEVAEGWQTIKKTINKVYQLPDALFPHQIFFTLKGWNSIKKANGYIWKEVTTRGETSTGVIDYPTYTPKEGTAVNITANNVRIRSNPGTSANVIGVAPVGEYSIEQITIDLIDGYNWCKAKGIDGWVALIAGASDYIDPPVKDPEIPVVDTSNELAEANKKIAELELAIKNKDIIIQELRDSVSALQTKIAEAKKVLT